MKPVATVRWSLCRVAVCLVLTLLAACRVADPPVEAADGTAPPPAAPGRVATVEPEAAAELPAAPPVEATSVEDFEVEQARRLAAARDYLERARSDAEERHRLSLRTCRDEALDPDSCVATADESLQAELRAARVEFDAQMMQPN